MRPGIKFHQTLRCDGDNVKEKLKGSLTKQQFKYERHKHALCQLQQDTSNKIQLWFNYGSTATHPEQIEVGIKFVKNFWSSTTNTLPQPRFELNRISWLDRPRINVLVARHRKPQKFKSIHSKNYLNAKFLKWPYQYISFCSLYFLWIKNSTCFYKSKNISSPGLLFTFSHLQNTVNLF